MLRQKETNYTPEIGYLVFRKCTPSWFMYEQVVEGWSITYLTAGSASFTINGKELEARAGDLLCLSPGTIRIGATYEGSLMECFAVDFALKRVPGESASLPLPTLSRIGIRKDIIRDFQELNFAWMDRQPGYAVRVRGIFLLILHRMLELTALEGSSADPDPRVERMIRYVASHYPDKLTLQSMAAELGMNAVYLGTLFKGRTGLSFNQYLTRARVRNAESMLRSGEYAVAEVAEACGFSDQFHFDKRFKEIMGFPPSSCIPKK